MAIRTAHCPLNQQAGTMHSIGTLLLAMGRLSEAMGYLRRCLAICQDNSMSYGEGMTLFSLGDAYQTEGKRIEARLTWQRAHDILAGLGVPEAVAVQYRLYGG